MSLVIIIIFIIINYKLYEDNVDGGDNRDDLMMTLLTIGTERKSSRRKGEVKHNNVPPWQLPAYLF